MDRTDVTVVVEVGPHRVSGPGVVAPELESAALESIDDDLALLDDQPIAVEALWRDVLCTAIGGHDGAVALVCPSWWSATRMALIRTAANHTAAKVDVVHRSELLLSGASAVVEFASELVLVVRRDSLGTVLPRADTGLVDALVDAVANCATVIVDAPVGEDRVPAATVARRLTAEGVDVTRTDYGRIAAAVAAGCAQPGLTADGVRRRVNRRAVSAVSGAVLAVVAAVGAGAVTREEIRPVDDVPMTLLVEGRVGVLLPKGWAVQRIASGPGSPRVQALSPIPGVAVHITQSPVPPDRPAALIAETLRAALEAQPPGVFVDFATAVSRAGREVTEYREVRNGHHTQWAVLVDNDIRIGIGCQSPPHETQAVQHACDEAIRSAHELKDLQVEPNRSALRQNPYTSHPEPKGLP